MHSNPHFQPIRELVRISNNNGYDLVLSEEGGWNLRLRVVQAGKLAHGERVIASFIHCGSLTCEWLDNWSVRVTGEFEASTVPIPEWVLAQTHNSVDLKVERFPFWCHLKRFYSLEGRARRKAIRKDG